MTIKHIVDEWFSDYKKPSLFVFTSQCSGKCCTELGIPADICQNHEWAKKENICIPDNDICERYLSNKITKAIVFGGFEPFEQYSELKTLIARLRTDHHCNDDIVIYTGFYPNEISGELNDLCRFSNIIIKFGRYVPNSIHRFDDILGVELSSDNQFGAKIS